MSGKIKLFTLLALLSVFTPRCNKVKPSSTLNTAGTAKLCIAGGATLDPQANICVCPQNLEWTGQKCEAIQNPGAHLAETNKSDKTQGQIQGAENSELQEITNNEEVTSGDQHQVIKGNPDQGAKSQWIAKLKRKCLAAKATFIEKDHFCLCPDAKVLIDQTCRILQGKLTDDVCLRAVRPGQWSNGHCSCIQNLVFSPSRGGCVPPISYARHHTGKSGIPNKGFLLIQKRNCESSVNKGLWNPETLDCDCGSGKVFFQDLCTEKQKLSSKDICETFGQRGKWIRDQKTCQCPIGKLWVNQRCTPYSEVTPQDGCHSNGSGGIWDASTNTCSCPPGKIWAISGKSCRQAAH